MAQSPLLEINRHNADDTKKRKSNWRRVLWDSWDKPPEVRQYEINHYQGRSLIFLTGKKAYFKDGSHVDDIRLLEYVYQVFGQVRIILRLLWENLNILTRNRSNLQSAFVSGMKEDLSLYGNVRGFSFEKLDLGNNGLIGNELCYNRIRSC